MRPDSTVVSTGDDIGLYDWELLLTPPFMWQQLVGDFGCRENIQAHLRSSPIFILPTTVLARNATSSAFQPIQNVTVTSPHMQFPLEHTAEELVDIIPMCVLCE